MIVEQAQSSWVSGRLVLSGSESGAISAASVPAKVGVLVRLETSSADWVALADTLAKAEAQVAIFILRPDREVFLYIDNANKIFCKASGVTGSYRVDWMAF